MNADEASLDFERLLTTCQKSLKRLVYYKISTTADAEDVLSEVYLAALKKFHTLQDKGLFRAWIFAIARNKIYDYYRRAAKLLELPLDEAISYTVYDAPFGERTSEVVEETLNNLREQDKQILYLFYFKQKPQAEIAKILQVPLGTVKSRLYAAKQSFKENYPYSYHTTCGGFPPKGKMKMKQLPEIMPAYTIIPSDKAAFTVKWEELLGLFLVPKLGEKTTWGLYETPQGNRTEWSEMEAVGKAAVHGVEGVEIHESRYNLSHEKIVKATNCYVAQLTDTHCRYLAEIYEKNGIKRYVTFLDEDFNDEWGFGLDSCGKEVQLSPKGLIRRTKDQMEAPALHGMLDVVGRYTIEMNGNTYDTICIMEFNAYQGQYIAVEQFIDKNGKTVLWRRYNRNDWHMDRYHQPWSEKLPMSQTITANGETYVHWYDCITDYIL